MKDTKESFVVGNMSINGANRSVVIKDKHNSEYTLKFTQTEFKLLTCLARNPEKVFSREELFTHLGVRIPRIWVAMLMCICAKLERSFVIKAVIQLRRYQE